MIKNGVIVKSRSQEKPKIICRVQIQLVLTYKNVRIMEVLKFAKTYFSGYKKKKIKKMLANARI